MPRALGVLALALALAAPARAQELDAKTVKESIDRGLTWLRALLGDDGSFQAGHGYGPDVQEVNFPLGRTALGVLTLLKCGVAPDDPKISRAFDHMYSLPLEKTYSVAVLILAIEARFAPGEEDLEKEEEKRGYGGVARRIFAKRARPADKQKLQECVDWLVANRHKAVWRYPGPAQDGMLEDNSNAQYALLALKGARRLGARVPPDVFEKVADHFVAQQDKDGPEVAWFAVPAADGPIHDMLPPEKREKLVRKAEEKRRKEEGTSERGPGSGEKARMRARGWSYLPRGSGGATDDHGALSTGSMTASGVAALCIAKSELEQDKRWGARQDTVEQAIRDGCAWLAKHWTPEANPTAKPGLQFNWKYYYLYGAERAGVLAGTYRFGPHDWWDSGALHLLKQQGPNGEWPAEHGLSEYCTTCFALLFLKRATIPLVPLPPKRVMTGGGK